METKTLYYDIDKQMIFISVGTDQYSVTVPEIGYKEKPIWKIVVVTSATGVFEFVDVSNVSTWQFDIAPTENLNLIDGESWAKSLNDDIDSTHASEGYVLVTIDTDTSTFILGMGVGVDQKLVFGELSGIESGGYRLYRLRFQVRAKGSLMVAGTPGEPLSNYYMKTESDARYMRALISPTAGDIMITNGVGQAEDSGVLLSSIVGGMIYQNEWNANTNTPTLVSSTGTKGHYYVVSVGGTTTLDGISSWLAGDWVVFNGTVWQKISNAVYSVFGRVGAITAQANDYTWAQIDKTVSSIADITTRSHTSLTDIGTNTHAQIDSHITSTSNPHATTYTQVGAEPANANIQSHISSTSNPHATTASQVAAIPNSVITAIGDYIRGTGVGTYTIQKNNFSASVAPTVTDDSSAGYSVGSIWIDTTADELYICVDSTVGSAVWKIGGIDNSQSIINAIIFG